MESLPYVPPIAVIPEANRGAINQGIINLIRSGANPDQGRVFAGFTGKGGLHGLKYGAFASRFEYSKAKREIEQGQFFTPDGIVAVIAEFLGAPAGEGVADLTCGAGAFANHFRDQEFFGLEIDPDSALVAQYLYPWAEIVAGDLRAWQAPERFRFVVGNPPFALRWNVPQCPMANAVGEAASEDVFLWQVRLSMAAGGTACFVAPASWLNDDLVDAKALAFVAEHFERVSEVLLPVGAFAAYGVEHFATKIVLLRRWLPGEQSHPTTPSIVDARTLAGAELVTAWRKACPGYATFRAKLGGIRAVLEHANQKARRTGVDDKTQHYRFLRLLSELTRRDPAAGREQAEAWAQACAPTRYEANGQPIAKPSKETVIRKTRRALREIDVPPQPLARVVRTSHGLKVKTFNRAAALAVGTHKIEFSNLEVANGDVSLADIEAALARAETEVNARNLNCRKERKGFEVVRFERLNVRRLVTRLQRRFALWTRPLSAEAPELEQVHGLLREYYVRLAPCGVRVLEKQLDPLARATAKPGALLGWEMGTGKSLAGCAWNWAKLAEDKAVRANRAGGWTLLVASALAIELHWTGQLDDYGIEYSRPGSRAEWRNIGGKPVPGERYLLATHHQLARYAKVIRGLVRQGTIRALIVDESDEFGNRGARRSQALSTAGRECRHKLLMTGTPVRNRASELFSQLALLFHGEAFFRCVAATQVVYDAKLGDFIEAKNPQYLASYHGHGGLALFKRCHSPSRPTVMGQEKSITRLPNRRALEEFLGCFRSRLRLRELLDHDPFERETVAVTLGLAEWAQYDKLVREAVEIARRHLAGTGEVSARRATLLSLAHAIRLLQQAASMPGKFGLAGLGSKESEIVEMIRESRATHIAVGVIWREAVDRLLPTLGKEFPDRVIVSFDGDDSFKVRRRKLAQLNAAPRGLVLCTQQSVRSSVNLPIVEEVIAEALPWNFTSLNQFCMRFCRLTSKRTVAVRILIAAGTIEERILGLLLCKEAVALPIAGDAIEGEDELFAEYGITAGDLDELAKYLAEYDPALREEPEDRSRAA